VPDIESHKQNEDQILIARVDELEQLKKARERIKIETFFPDEGLYHRGLYPKHINFFAAGTRHIPLGDCPRDCDGSAHRERGFMAANRIGKTLTASYEVACHATGRYPPWWPGARFPFPVTVWSCGKRNNDVRDVNQLALLGEYEKVGTGMIPYQYITGEPAKKPGVQKAFESVNVKHISGGTSNIIFKSYEEGWKAFAGRSIHVIWCDEEPPIDVYAECQIRTMATGAFKGGLILLTFTPLEGVTEVVKGFLDTRPDRLEN